jgi:hypothetical protein
LKLELKLELKIETSLTYFYILFLCNTIANFGGLLVYANSNEITVCNSYLYHPLLSVWYPFSMISKVSNYVFYRDFKNANYLDNQNIFLSFNLNNTFFQYNADDSVTVFNDVILIIDLFVPLKSL